MTIFSQLRSDLVSNAEARSDLLSNEASVKTAFTLRFLSLALHRVSHSLHLRNLSSLALAIKQFNNILTGADIAPEASLGPGVVLYHPTGVVIGPRCTIGANVVIQSGVSIGGVGGRGRSNNPGPTIGSNSELGAGSRVIGPISLATDTIVGANAVVTRSVLDSGTTMAGVPARAIEDR